MSRQNSEPRPPMIQPRNILFFKPTSGEIKAAHRMNQAIAAIAHGDIGEVAFRYLQALQAIRDESSGYTLSLALHVLTHLSDDLIQNNWLFTLISMGTLFSATAPPISNALRYTDIYNLCEQSLLKRLGEEKTALIQELNFDQYVIPALHDLLEKWKIYSPWIQSGVQIYENRFQAKL